MTAPAFAAKPRLAAYLSQEHRAHGFDKIDVKIMILQKDCEIVQMMAAL